MAKKGLSRPPKPYEVQRPPWIPEKAPAQEQVVSPREFFQMMRGR